MEGRLPDCMLGTCQPRRHEPKGLCRTRSTRKTYWETWQRMTATFKDQDWGALHRPPPREPRPASGRPLACGGGRGHRAAMFLIGRNLCRAPDRWPHHLCLNTASDRDLTTTPGSPDPHWTPRWVNNILKCFPLTVLPSVLTRSSGGAKTHLSNAERL